MAIAFQTLTPAQMTAVLNGPAATPPPGVKPDFNTQSSFLPAFSAVVALCVGITSLAILARIYTKLFLMRSVAYEDCKSSHIPSFWFKQAYSYRTPLS